jgi:hypothetical protein
MSVVSKLFAVVIGSAILLTGSAASAAKYLVSFSGVIASGEDASGLFGAPGSLTGKSFVATYFVASNAILDGVPGVFQNVILPAPTLTIGGTTFAFSTEEVMIDYGRATPGELDFNYSMAFSNSVFRAEGIQNTAFANWFQPSFDFGSSAVISAPGGGSFSIKYTPCTICQPDNQIHTYGQFATDTVTITAVPEPATWAMMISGFGLAGAALRRRRATAA